VAFAGRGVRINMRAPAVLVLCAVCGPFLGASGASGVETEGSFNDRTLIVRWAASEGARDAAAAPPAWYDSLGLEITWRSRLVPGLAVVRVTPGLAPLAQLLLSADPGILGVVPDPAVTTSSGPDDPDYPAQTAMQRVKMPCAWRRRTDGSLPIIAVVDKGVDFNLFDLQSNIEVNMAEAMGEPGVDDDGNGIVDDIVGAQFVQPFDTLYTTPNDPTETININGELNTDDHGTPIATIIGAAGDNGEGIAGVAWSCRIVPVKIGGSFIFLSDVLQGLEYANGRGARIVNCSWYFEFAAAGEILEEMILATPKTLYVVSANNQNRDLDALGSARQYPAMLTEENILCVGATDDEDRRWGWDGGPEGSNWGRESVDLFAPGVAVISESSRPWEPIARYTGTSFAAPIVVGVAALVWSEHPTWLATDVRRHLIESVTPLPGLERRCVSGGRLNAAKALGAGCE